MRRARVRTEASRIRVQAFDALRGEECTENEGHFEEAYAIKESDHVCFYWKLFCGQVIPASSEAQKIYGMESIYNVRDKRDEAAESGVYSTAVST